MTKVNVFQHYTNISGKEAEKRLLRGGSVYNWEGYECKIDKVRGLIGDVGEDEKEWIDLEHISLLTISMSDNWYIPENDFTGTWIHPDQMGRELEVGDYVMAEGNPEPIIHEVTSIDENDYACDRDGSMIDYDHIVAVKKVTKQ